MSNGQQLVAEQPIPAQTATGRKTGKKKRERVNARKRKGKKERDYLQRSLLQASATADAAITGVPVPVEQRFRGKKVTLTSRTFYTLKICCRKLSARIGSEQSENRPHSLVRIKRRFSSIRLSLRTVMRIGTPNLK